MLVSRLHDYELTAKNENCASHFTSILVRSARLDATRGADPLMTRCTSAIFYSGDIMKTIYHAANTRGDADHGWLKSKHSFSFANYYDPERMGFGALRVINDDYIMGGQGFGKHSHRDMEIITLPLSGKLSHGDSLGNQGIIESGEIQVMSAGTGIMHSEMNGDAEQPVQLLQIWVESNKSNVAPRYQQIALDQLMQPNQFNQILSPDPDDAGVWIHQQAWFSLGRFEQGISKNYLLHGENQGVYIFVIAGEVSVNNTTLHRRDGLAVWDTPNVTLDILQDAEILLMEVPM